MKLPNDRIKELRKERFQVTADEYQALCDCAEAYPRLVEALREFASAACFDDGVLDSHLIEDCTELTEKSLRNAHALLRELGELKEES
jgi:hypothetical protein